MALPEPPVLLRFESFELDLRTRELRKDGRLVKLQDLPVKLLALLAGAAHFLQPRVAEVMSRWYVWGVDALFVAAALWTIYELGWREESR